MRADVMVRFLGGLIKQEDLQNFCYTPNLKIINFVKKEKYQSYAFQEDQ